MANGWQTPCRPRHTPPVETTTVTVGEPIRLSSGDVVDDGAERSYFSPLFSTDVVTNVAVPTITPVLPTQGCGTGVVVAPGGGFHALSINSEGFDVARWLAERGVAAFVLKYRLVPSGDDAVAEMFQKGIANVEADIARAAPLAGEDGIAAMRLVRAQAATFGVDPSRLGIVGFSAGGNVALQTAYAPDAAARPDFVAAIYSSLRGIDAQDPPAGSGPMFIVAASNDQLGLAPDSLEIYRRWYGAGLPVELHMYASGGHGFGMRKQGLASDTWVDRFGDWLDGSGLLAM